VSRRGRARLGLLGPRAAGGLALIALASGVPRAGSAPDPCPAPEPVAGEGRLAAVRCAAAPAGADRLAGAARLLFGRGLDPNRAEAAALEALPRIGPARAAAIVREARVQPFCEPADLERVEGIGPATRRALAGWIEMPPRAGCGRR